MAVGFAQSMYALDAADGESGGGVVVVNGLIQALLGQVVSSNGQITAAVFIADHPVRPTLIPPTTASAIPSD